MGAAIQWQSVFLFVSVFRINLPMGLRSFGYHSEGAILKRKRRQADENGITFGDREILVCLANGLSLKDSAIALGWITVGSMDTYRRRLYQKIGVHNAAQAVAWAFRNKYLI